MALYGIRLRITNDFTLTDGSRRIADTELQRTLSSTSSSTTPSTSWDTFYVGGIGGGTTQGTRDDGLPNDGLRRFYRCRHVSPPGVNPSSWLGVVDAIPTQLTTELLW